MIETKGLVQPLPDSILSVAFAECTHSQKSFDDAFTVVNFKKVEHRQG